MAYVISVLVVPSLPNTCDFERWEKRMSLPECWDGRTKRLAQAGLIAGVAESTVDQDLVEGVYTQDLGYERRPLLL